jgi:hypothetical protein
MARGFESKSVASQQDERDQPTPERAPIGDPVLLARRRRLELGRADVLRQLQTARAGAHREMLERARAALDEELQALGSGTSADASNRS